VSLLNLTTATQDIGTDGLAVSRRALRLRGLGNRVQVIGYKIGMVLERACCSCWSTDPTVANRMAAEQRESMVRERIEARTDIL
jgi:hypothetical protein